MKRKLIIGITCLLAGSMGIVAQVSPKSLGSIGGFSGMGHENIKIYEDSLFVNTPIGLMARSLQEEGEWEPYAFTDIAFKDFCKSGNKLMMHTVSELNPYRGEVYLSDDYGKTYSILSSFMLDGQEVEADIPNVVGMYQSPLNPDKVILYITWGTLYITEDFGKTWTTVNYPGSNITKLCFHPKDDNIFVIGENGPIEEQAFITVTYDNGKTWSELYDMGDQSMTVQYLGFNPDDPKEVLGYTFTQRVHTADGGQSWDFTDWDGSIEKYISVFPQNKARDSINEDYLYKTVNSLTGKPGDPDCTMTRGVLMSTDCGNSWTALYSETIPSNNYYFAYTYIKPWRGNLILASYFDNEFWMIDLDSINKIIASKEEIVLDGEGWDYTNGILSFAGANGGIQVYDIAGRCVATTAEGTLDMANISKGVYIAIAADSDARTSSFRFIHR